MTRDLVPAGAPANVPQHVVDDYLPPTARELIIKGIPPTTLKAYAWQWHLFRSWCEARGRTFAPVRQNTMIAYLDHWRPRPVHTRCVCREHRPSPSTMWVWYSAVRFYHAVGEPPLPWEMGENLSRAMKGYAEEMVELGWEPSKAPRAYDGDVTRMIDGLDLGTGQGLRDRAIILTNFYTAARASDLATYRIGDVASVPKGIEFTLRMSKTNKQVGRKVEKRRMFTNTSHPQYCGVVAVTEWRAWLAGQGITGGALFRPFNRWGQLARGAADQPSYRMESVNITRAVSRAAIAAGLDNADRYTSHSLRRGRATQQRELGIDPIEIARAYGWVPGGAILAYLEEAEGWSASAPGSVGAL
jgi:integrase